MKAYILGIVMNFVAAIVLFGQGAAEMNNLDTSIPAILCVIAGVFGIIQIRRDRKELSENRSARQ